MKPFLLLATRAEDAAADGEYRAFLDAGKLSPDQLHRVRVEAGPLPAIDLDAYSAIIVGGSPYNASDPVADKSATQLRVESELADLLDEVVARDFPFFGACYGIGLLGSHQRGVIDRTWGEPISAVRVTVTPDGANDPLFGGLEPAFDAFVGHKEACRVLPTGAVLLASGETCPVQAFRIGQNVYATQFHPELTVPGLIARIRVYRDYGYFEPTAMEKLITDVGSSRVTEPGHLVAAFVERYAAA
ncbi:MAG: glutamine amidotransferase [Burkholderiaceae bacterium]|nr:glutamine amidotransferase [Microbacteriaceae bacterium]